MMSDAFSAQLSGDDSLEPSSNEDFGGMFSTRVEALKDLPCSLYFPNKIRTTGVPERARRVLKIVHEELLGGSLGEKCGCYGASGGPVYIMYLGSEDQAALSSSSGTDHRASTNPNLRTLLEMLHMSEEYISYNWMTTVDPMHQDLFVKVRTNVDEAGPAVLSLDRVMEVLHSNIPCRTLVADVPGYVVSNYPCLQEGKLLFLLPLFANLHDGDCLGNQAFCPVAEAFHQRVDRSEYWWQFQNRPEHNAPIILESSSDGTTMASSDIQQSPVLAIFQTLDGDVFALAQWDYRD